MEESNNISQINNAKKEIEKSLNSLKSNLEMFTGLKKQFENGTLDQNKLMEELKKLSKSLPDVSDIANKINVK